MSHTAIPPRTGSAYAPTIDRDMLRVAANVERSGMHVVHVGEGCDCGDCAATPLPPDERFGYTIGLTACLPGRPPICWVGGARPSWPGRSSMPGTCCARAPAARPGNWSPYAGRPAPCAGRAGTNAPPEPGAWPRWS